MLLSTHLDIPTGVSPLTIIRLNAEKRNRVVLAVFA